MLLLLLAKGQDHERIGCSNVDRSDAGQQRMVDSAWSAPQSGPRQRQVMAGFDRWLGSNRLADAPGLTRQQGRRPPTRPGRLGTQTSSTRTTPGKEVPPTNSAMTSLRLVCFVAVVLASPEKPKRMPPLHPKSGCNHHAIARQINRDYDIHIRSFVPQSSAEIH